jgi:hypothetical protein
MFLGLDAERRGRERTVAIVEEHGPGRERCRAPGEPDHGPLQPLARRRFGRRQEPCLVVGEGIARDHLEEVVLEALQLA